MSPSLKGSEPDGKDTHGYTIKSKRPRKKASPVSSVALRFPSLTTGRQVSPANWRVNLFLSTLFHLFNKAEESARRRDRHDAAVDHTRLGGPGSADRVRLLHTKRRVRPVQPHLRG